MNLFTLSQQLQSLNSFPKTQQNSLKKIVIACMIGNTLEWYDFALYGHFAVILGNLFFPTTNHAVSLMATLSVFAAGFIMRPLGAIVFGHVGDKKGRKKALLWSVYLMTVPTTLIGFLPTYDQVGWLAPLLLTIIRLLQGLAIGGEFTGSMIFIVEHANVQKRGFLGSWAPFSLVFGILIGSIVATLLSKVLSSDELYQWGWRIPFILSGIGGFVGSYMRRILVEPQKFQKVKEKRRLQSIPLREIFKNHLDKVNLVLLIDLLVAVGFFATVSFIVSYLSVIIGISRSSALFINTSSMIVFIFVIPFSGWLTDKIGWKTVMAGAAFIFAILTYPLFLGFSSGDIEVILICHMMMSAIMGFYFAPIPSVLVEIFPMHIRYSGLSISHNLSMAIFGGTLPPIALWLVHMTEDKTAPAFYLILAAFISLFGLYLYNQKLTLKIKT